MNFTVARLGEDKPYGRAVAADQHEVDPAGRWCRPLWNRAAARDDERMFPVVELGPDCDLGRCDRCGHEGLRDTLTLRRFLRSGQSGGTIFSHLAIGCNSKTARSMVQHAQGEGKRVEARFG